MKYENGAFIYTTIHEFKSNISAYIRLLERDVKRGVVIMRRNEEVALFQALKPRLREMQQDTEDVGSSDGFIP